MKPNNVMTFPAATAAERVSGARQHRAPATIIDLVSRRPDTGGAGVEKTSNALTVGDVWEALNDGRLQLQYQPQYDMVTGETVSVEALVRLVDTDGALVFPDRFIEMVEQSDLIVPMGRAVIARACADLAACRAAGFELQRVAINLSARQLQVDTGLLDYITQTLAGNDLQYDDLEFELTERQNLTPECASLSILNELSERGARIVIDDFGVGYSSVVYLTELPTSALKLDRSLVSRLPEDKSLQIVVNSLLGLARDLGLEVVAEGIETNEQHEYLARAGCPYAQGYGYARPMAIDDLHAFLTEHDPASRPGLHQGA